jgi:glycerophosphoryl diester phosphodiesterase
MPHGSALPCLILDPWPCQHAPVQQRLPSLLDDPIAFAHRGARAYAPENTIEAFQLALKLGVNGLESDVWITAEGIPVLDHDGVVRRAFGRSTPIAQVQRANLPGHIPELAELVAGCGTRYHLSLDVRDEVSGQRVIDVITEVAPSLLPRVWLCAPRWQILLPLRDQGVKLVDSTRLEKLKEGPERRAATLAAERIDGVNLFHTDWNGGLVALFHRFERTAFAWGIQEQHLLDRTLRMGIDGVFSDYPDRMMDAYRTALGAPRPVTD